jgi:hypothetical protein
LGGRLRCVRTRIPVVAPRCLGFSLLHVIHITATRIVSSR